MTAKMIMLGVVCFAVGYFVGHWVAMTVNKISQDFSKDPDKGNIMGN